MYIIEIISFFLEYKILEREIILRREYYCLRKTKHICWKILMQKIHCSFLSSNKYLFDLV